MNPDKMNTEELLEELWKASNPEQAREERARDLRLRTALVLSGLSLAGAACWTSLLVFGPCIDATSSYQSACQSEMFMREKWGVLSAWVIAGVLVILLLMWAKRAQRGGG